MLIAPYVQTAIEKIEAKGFFAYLVGGSLRDLIRGVPVNDWDIATSATPDQMKEVFAGHQTIETGIQHGTLSVILDQDQVEITTFRRDGEYLDYRRPVHVGFVNSIEEDLARRDFTMNAIAYNPKTGLVDPYGGIGDIDYGIIRSVGDPDNRLNEDALRIMRALRFAATMGFEIENDLSKSLHTNRALLAKIAPERICTELMKMLIGEDILSTLLDYPDVLAAVIPEIQAAVGFDQKSKYHRYDIWEHTARAVEAGKPDPTVRLALLFHDLGKPAKFFIDDTGEGHFYGHDILSEELARARLKELRFSNSLIDSVATAIRFHQIRVNPDTTQKWLRRLGEDMLRLVIEVSRGDMAAHADEVVSPMLAALQSSEERLDELIAKGQCFRISDLAINGNDLKAIGLEEGREIGRVLSYLLDMVIDGDLENTREELLLAAEACSAI